MEELKQKVKKVVTGNELAPGFPILFSTSFGDTYEYYLYPYKDRFQEALEGKILDLNLNDIIKAFIGGEYV